MRRRVTRLVRHVLNSRTNKVHRVSIVRVILPLRAMMSLRLRRDSVRRFLLVNMLSVMRLRLRLPMMVMNHIGLLVWVRVFRLLSQNNVVAIVILIST